MKKMARYMCHFYHWYDTESLTPLQPKYISTVDSGNLAGHLLVLRQGLLALPRQKIQSTQLLEGLRDTLGVLTETSNATDIKLLTQINVGFDAITNSKVYTLIEMKNEVKSLVKNFNLIIDKFDSDMESKT